MNLSSFNELKTFYWDPVEWLGTVRTFSKCIWLTNLQFLLYFFFFAPPTFMHNKYTTLNTNKIESREVREKERESQKKKKSTTTTATKNEIIIKRKDQSSTRDEKLQTTKKHNSRKSEVHKWNFKQTFK